MGFICLFGHAKLPDIKTNRPSPKAKNIDHRKGALDGGVLMLHVKFEKRPCRMSLSVVIKLEICPLSVFRICSVACQ